MSGLANIEVPRGRQAIHAWRRLDRRTRRDVTLFAWQGIGHPDPQVAAIAMGRAQATLRLPLWRWALVVVAGLLIGWPLMWGLGLLASGLRDQWIWFVVPISSTLAMLVKTRMQARQLERANLATLECQ